MKAILKGSKEGQIILSTKSAIKTINIIMTTAILHSTLQKRNHKIRRKKRNIGRNIQSVPVSLGKPAPANRIYLSKSKFLIKLFV